MCSKGQDLLNKSYYFIKDDLELTIFKLQVCVSESLYSLVPLP